MFDHLEFGDGLGGGRVGLQGRFAEAETIARADLPPDQAAANVAYLRQVLAHKGNVPLSNQAGRYSQGPS